MAVGTATMAMPISAMQMRWRHEPAISPISTVPTSRAVQIQKEIRGDGVSSQPNLPMNWL